jgi:hypothetical protein
MRRANVGCFVGFRGRKIVQTDIDHANKINSLNRNCRECRASITGETSGELRGCAIRTIAIAITSVKHGQAIESIGVE